MPTKKPRYRPNLSTLDNVAAEVGKIYRLMRNGDIPVQDGSKYTYVLREMFSMLEKIKTVRSIEELEAQIAMLKEGQTHVGNDDEIAKIAGGLQ